MNEGQRRSVSSMTELDRARIADEISRQLYRIVATIDRGEITASATMRAYLEGAVVALDAIASDDPVAALDAMRESLNE